MNAGPVLARLPRELDELARALLHGELRTRVSLLSEPEDVRVARSMVNRLVTGWSALRWLCPRRSCSRPHHGLDPADWV